MKYLTERIHQLVDLYLTLKSKNLDWLSAHQDQQIKLSDKQRLAQKTLTAELTKKGVKLAHEMELLKTRQQAELAMLKTRCQEDIKDYQDYLESLSRLKLTLQASYAHLPDAIIHTIHHHAKSLLNAMWETEDLNEKIKREAQLIEFMTTMHKEALLFHNGTQPHELPENTLKLISNDYHHYPSRLN